MIFTQAFLQACLLSTVLAVPQRQRQTPRQQLDAKVPQGISDSKDGGKILDSTVMINGLPIRYRVAGPAAMFKAASKVPGAEAQDDTQGTMGINVLLHGDGGQSFVDFPNQKVQENVMGVAVASPDKQLLWGGPNRVNGAAHSQAVNDLIKNELPKMLAFNESQVMFMGVSGGSVMMAGYFIPAQMKNYQNSAVLLSCGGMAPQVPFQDEQKVISTTRIHYQTTVNELTSLQKDIPAAVQAYETSAKNAGMTEDQIAQMQTIDNTPKGGHCAFDEQSFVSGVQLVANNYARVVMPGGDGMIEGVGDVRKSVVGNERPTFGPERRQKL